jgi:hypothetical protein
MSNWKSWIFNDESSALADSKAARRRAALLSAPLALMGLFALVLLVHDGLLGGLNRQKAMTLLSAAAVCVGLIALIFAVSSKKQAIKAAATKTTGEKPWLNRKDWMDGRVKSSSRKAVWLLWIFIAFWCGVSGVISLFIVPAQLNQGNRAALCILIFPVVGLVMIFFALNATLAWRKFSRSIFEMPAVPAASGGSLAGSIQVKARLQPQHGLHLRLTCVRRTTTGKSNNRQTTEKILWQDEKWLRADLPQTDLNATSIPVYFKLPDNLPESTAAIGDGIHWKLEASAKLRGPNFDAAFEVPVFKQPEPPQISDDPTVPYQMSLDEMRKKIRSKIQVNDLPDGKEFIFPAARNPGFVAGATAIWLVWTVVIIVLVCIHAPPLLPLVAAAGDLLMMIFLINLWLHRSHVAIAAGQVKIELAWFQFKKQHVIKSADVANFATEIGANVGHSAYYDLKVRTRAGQEFTLAKHLGNKPEADWLVRQMSAALKNFSATASNP